MPTSQRLSALVDRLDRDSALRPIATKLLYIEQPMPREITRQSPLGALARRDFIIDEADDSYDAFPVARALGYRGISSKSCKGIYKSIINATRAAKWSAGGERFFVIGRGLDLSGRPRRAAGPRAWRIDRRHPCRAQRPPLCRWFCRYARCGGASFLAAHPDLYARDGNSVRLSIHDGDLLTGSLTSPGFATGIHPDWSALSPLEQPKTKNLKEQAI